MFSSADAAGRHALRCHVFASPMRRAYFEERWLMRAMPRDARSAR